MQTTQTVSNIDFTSLKPTHVLPLAQQQEFWDTLFVLDAAQYGPKIKELPLLAFELGMSVALQTEQKKVCRLCQPD